MEKIDRRILTQALTLMSAWVEEVLPIFASMMSPSQARASALRYLLIKKGVLDETELNAIQAELQAAIEIENVAGPMGNAIQSSVQRFRRGMEAALRGDTHGY